jgi:hypothetical protein
VKRGSLRATHVGEIRSEQRGGEYRVTAVIDGEPLWFASEDIDLSPEPEAFASALLLPSLHRNRPLVVDSPVSTMWADNAAKLTEIWSAWWGYRTDPTNLERRADNSSREPRTALAFTAGVDSFYSLLQGRKPEMLMSVHGFDVPLADTYRMSRFEASTRTIASELGVESLIVRTNLREHPSLGPRRLWERAHGGSIAAVGHLLSARAGNFTISSTYSSSSRPWGSTGDTDPLFSSDRVMIGQFGGDHARDGKIKLIADNPLVQNHLRVCWENRAKAGNCSRCGKCLAAMLMLAELHLLDEFKVFDGMKVLPSRLDELPYLKNNINIAQRIVNRGQLPPDVDSAVRRLLSRSRRAARIRSYRDRVRDVILRG